LHPLHVESVAWISERKDVLSTFFGLLALWAYARYAQNKKTLNPQLSTLNYTMAVFFFALGLMSKPMLVTLPFLMLLLDWWPLGRVSGAGCRVPGAPAPVSQLSTFGRLILEKIPFFGLSAISCVVTFMVQQKGGAIVKLARISMTGRIENTFVSYARYLGRTLWPAALANPYPHPGHWEFSLVIYSVVLVAGLSAMAVLFARRFPFVFTGWFWFVGTLVPVIGLVQVGGAAMADRYSYLPLVGLFVILAWGGGELWLQRCWPKPFIVLGGRVAAGGRRLADPNPGGLLAKHRNTLSTCAGRDPEQHRCLQQTRLLLLPPGTHDRSHGLLRPGAPDQPGRPGRPV